MVAEKDILIKKILLKQSLDKWSKCLPLTEIVIEIEYGRIETKATICPSNLNQNIFDGNSYKYTN